MQPTLFIPHGGGPWPFIEWPPEMAAGNDALAAFLGSLLGSLDVAPRAVLVISGHWEQPRPTVTDRAVNELLFDYGGFPPNTYALEYAAPGSPALAARVRSLLGAAGFATAADPQRGLDHGVFIPFMLVAPGAPLPIVQLSLVDGLDARLHLALGHALAPLRAEEILIVGSGMSYHNMRGFQGGGAPGAAEFDAWLRAAATAPPHERDALLAGWMDAPRRAARASPRRTSAPAHGRRRCRGRRSRGGRLQRTRPGRGGLRVSLRLRPKESGDDRDVAIDGPVASGKTVGARRSRRARTWLYSTPARCTVPRRFSRCMTAIDLDNERGDPRPARAPSDRLSTDEARHARATASRSTAPIPGCNLFDPAVAAAVSRSRPSRRARARWSPSSAHRARRPGGHGRPRYRHGRATRGALQVFPDRFRSTSGPTGGRKNSPSADVTSSFDEVRDQIEERDRLDTTRAVAPLRAADDAIQIDSTGSAPADVVARMRKGSIRRG